MSQESPATSPIQGMESPPTFWAANGLRVFAILSYCVVSLSVVYYNWWVFTVGFRYPVFVSWVQQVTGTVLFYLGTQIGYYFTSFRTVFPAVKLSRDTAWKICPLTASFVLMVGLANICLQKTLISTYQVARSLTLLFVIALSYLILKERQSWIVLSACGLMCLGFVIASLDPTTLSLAGLLTGGASSFFQSLYNVYIKRSLPHVQDNSQALLFYNLLLSSTMFIPMVLVCEPGIVWKEAFGMGPDGTSKLWTVWPSMILSGILGTTLNMTTYLVVKVTSPLSFNIVGFTKALIQSLGGIVFLGDKVTVAGSSGIGLCLTGSLVYAKAKYDEAEAKTQAQRIAAVTDGDANLPFAGSQKESDPDVAATRSRNSDKSTTASAASFEDRKWGGQVEGPKHTTQSDEEAVV